MGAESFKSQEMTRDVCLALCHKPQTLVLGVLLLPLLEWVFWNQNCWKNRKEEQDPTSKPNNWFALWLFASLIEQNWSHQGGWWGGKGSWWVQQNEPRAPNQGFIQMLAGTEQKILQKRLATVKYWRADRLLFQEKKKKKSANLFLWQLLTLLLFQGVDQVFFCLSSLGTRKRHRLRADLPMMHRVYFTFSCACLL